MRYLLDSVAFLRFIEGSGLLSPQVKAILTADDSILILSYASIWEIAIKVGLGKLKLPFPLEDFLYTKFEEHRITLLPLQVSDMIAAGLLPLHHRDPFDRLLVAQALADGLPIISSDAHFDAYGVQRIW